MALSRTIKTITFLSDSRTKEDTVPYDLNVVYTTKQFYILCALSTPKPTTPKSTSVALRKEKKTPAWGVGVQGTPSTINPSLKATQYPFSLADIYQMALGYGSASRGSMFSTPWVTRGSSGIESTHRLLFFRPRT